MQFLVPNGCALILYAWVTASYFQLPGDTSPWWPYMHRLRSIVIFSRSKVVILSLIFQLVTGFLKFCSQVFRNLLFILSRLDCTLFITSPHVVMSVKRLWFFHLQKNPHSAKNFVPCLTTRTKVGLPCSSLVKTTLKVYYSIFEYCTFGCIRDLHATIYAPITQRDSASF